MRSADSAAVYPACHVARRAVDVGGQTKAELLERLARSGVQINELGRTLFASELFVASDVCRQIATVQLSVGGLGLPRGATLPELYATATRVGLGLCPVELGPHLRLQLLDQPEGAPGQPARPHRAPPGSITVASELLWDDDELPKGFYLRRIEGVLWLRGYRCAREHVWGPEDRFVFAEP